jgi:hypothetical protein
METSLNIIKVNQQLKAVKFAVKFKTLLKSLEGTTTSKEK